MPFQPWKPVCRLTLRFFPLCVYVCVCVMLLIETSGWETKRSQPERERVREPSSSMLAWYRVVSIGRHAAWGSLRIGFVTPQSAGWWMAIAAIGSLSLEFSCACVCAPTTHSHTSMLNCKRERKKRMGKQENSARMKRERRWKKK